MADATLKIVIEALNKASKPIGDLKNDLNGVNKISGKTTAVMNTLKNAIGVAGVTGAVLTVGKAIRDSITDWSAYAEQIEKSARLAGVSNEEMSRLTQAADDFRVSEEALNSAMVMALKNGFTPTIDNLADLSDQYVAIKNPADKAALASKIFGRQYAEMEPLLSRGGAAIKSATGDIADNLIVTDEAVAQNKEFIKVLDDFQDAATGLKNVLAMGLLPTLTDFFLLLLSPSANSAADFINEFFRGTFIESPVSKAARQATGTLADMNEQLRIAAEESTKAGDGMDVLTDATNNADEAMRNYNDALLFKIASEGLGEQAALQLAYKMGLVDDATVFATGKQKEWKKQLDDGKISVDTYNALVAGLAGNLALLESKEISITTNHYDNYYVNNVAQGGAVGGKKDDEEMRPTGGAVSRGRNYRWQEYGYPGEAFVPSQNGYVLSRSDAERILAQAAQGGRGGGDTYNLVINEAGRRGDTQRDFQLLKALAR